MVKTLLSITLFVIVVTGFSQKKRWILTDGIPVKKSEATCYYTRSKVKDSNYILIKRYYLDYEKPYEEIGFQSKNLLIKEGPYISYYKSGEIKVKTAYVNNIKSGVWEKHFVDGSSEKGLLINGKKTGIWKKFDSNKELSLVQNYNKGLLEGDYLEYKELQLTIKGSYINDRKNGLWNFYVDNQLNKTINYLKGVKDGESIFYYDNGVKSELIIYKLGRLISSVKYDKKGNEIASIEDEELIVGITDVQPEFPGGSEEMMRFLAYNTKYPSIAMDNNIQGRAYISFTVEKDGSITGVRPVAPKGREVHKSLVKEAIRVVKSMPKWNPGKINGKIARVKYTVPIYFKIR